MYGTVVKKVVGWILRDPMISLEFDARTYKLGESLDLSVEIVANRGMRISEGLVDLHHERRYIESSQKMVPDYMANRINMRANLAGRQPTKIMVPKRVTETFQDRYRHSSVDFLNDIELSENAVQKFNATMEIQSETPPHYGEGETKWILEVVLILPNGREITKEEEVVISIL